MLECDLGDFVGQNNISGPIRAKMLSSENFREPIHPAWYHAVANSSLKLYPFFSLNKV